LLAAAVQWSKSQKTAEKYAYACCCFEPVIMLTSPVQVLCIALVSNHLSWIVHKIGHT